MGIASCKLLMTCQQQVTVLIFQLSNFPHVHLIRNPIYFTISVVNRSQILFTNRISVLVNCKYIIYSI